MDVYTDPDTGTFIQWKVFSYPSEGGDVLAVSVPASVAFTLNTVYTLLTMSLFNALWNTLLHLIMLWAAHDNGLAWNLILSVFWNSAEPVAASSNLFLHLVRMISFAVGHKRTLACFRDRSIKLGGCLTLLALFVAASSIAGSILIPPQLILERHVAPVNPEIVWAPTNTEGRVGGTTAQWSVLFTAAAVRAVGSAEASKVTLRDRVNVSRPMVTEQSTDEKPDFVIYYNYNLTGVEMGIPHKLGLVHTVRGQCKTEYGWLQQFNSTPELESYVPWNASQYTDPVPSDNATNIRSNLNLGAPIFPDHVEQIPSNITFALIYRTAHLPTFTESDDAMYMTERMPEEDMWSQLYAFRVKAGRPALSCWQETLFCIDGNCGSVMELSGKGFPPGLNMLLSSLHNPTVIDIVQMLGPSALMSFYSSSPGTTIDAATSTTFRDIERIVLGAYLYSKNIFRDSTMMEPSEGFQNMVVNGRGKVLPGTGDFVLESRTVTAISLPVLISIPALALFILVLLGVLSCVAHPKHSFPWLQQNRERLVQLATPNLYRLANRREGVEDPIWRKKRHLHPVPTNEDDQACMPFLDVKPKSTEDDEATELSNLSV